MFQEHKKNVREFNECSCNSLENSIFWNKTYLQYIVHSIHTFFPTVSTIFMNVLIIRSWEGGFITFVFYGLPPSHLEMLP